MMKGLSIFVGLLLAATAPAQITVTSANMPAPGDTLRYSNALAASIDLSLTGANYHWHFDTLSPQGQGLRNFSLASATPYFFYFIGPGKYGEKILDSIGFGALQLKTIYSFYKTTSSVFSAEGTGITFSGIPLAAFYTDEDELYQFPLQYNNHDSTTFRYAITIPTLGYYSKTGYRITEVDGWGQIHTPYGTANCLRVVSTQYSTDSVVSSIITTGFPNVMRSYQWLTTTEKIPYLEVNGNVVGGNFVATQARYRDQARPVGIKELSASLGIQAFPNPAGDRLELLIPALQGPLDVEVYDNTGRLLKRLQMESQGATSLDLSDLAPGVYPLRFRHERGIQILRIVRL